MEKELILRALEDACCIYQGKLTPDQEAYRYLTNKRCIKDETIKKFRLGYAPCTRCVSNDLVTKELMKKHTLESLIDSGLTFVMRPEIYDNDHEISKIQCYFDLFRDHRIIIPIFNLGNEIIAFGARRLHEGACLKYITNHETVVFSKRHTLYGLNFARVAIDKAGHVFIFEGYFDVILAHQSGIENSVALMGTLPCQSHFDVLKSLFPSIQISICYVGDKTGRSAADRTKRDYEKIGNVKVFVMPDQLDPADIFQNNSKLEDCLVPA